MVEGLRNTMPGGCHRGIRIRSFEADRDAGRSDARMTEPPHTGDKETEGLNLPCNL